MAGRLEEVQQSLPSTSGFTPIRLGESVTKVDAQRVNKWFSGFRPALALFEDFLHVRAQNELLVV